MVIFLLKLMLNFHGKVPVTLVVGNVCITSGREKERERERDGEELTWENRG